MFDAERAVEVISRPERDQLPPGYGSGFYLGGGLVLTCAHVLPPGDGYRREVRRTNRSSLPFQTVWCNPHDDVALLRVDWPDVVDLVHLGVLPLKTTGEHLPFRLFGWARVTDDGGSRDPVQLDGPLNLAEVASGNSGTVILRPNVSMPAVSGDDWRGMSGAAVFCADHVVAVQIERMARADLLRGRLLTVGVLGRPDTERASMSALDILADAGIGVAVKLMLPEKKPPLSLASFLDRTWPGIVMIVVTGATDSAISLALRREVAQSAGRVRGSGIQPGQPTGGIDMAVDAARATTHQVRRRISEWRVRDDDAPARSSGRDMPETMFIDNIDDAMDPDRLLSEVITPLVQQAADHNQRLVLGFRGSAVPARLELLTQRVADVTEAGRAVRRRRRHVAERVADVPRVPGGISRLRIDLIEIKRLQVTGGSDDDVLAFLSGLEHDTDSMLYAITALHRRLNLLINRRDELRGLLEGVHARVAQSALSEDLMLGALYRRARQLLWTAPVNLVAAESGVGLYADQVRRRLEGQ